MSRIKAHLIAMKEAWGDKTPYMESFLLRNGRDWETRARQSHISQMEKKMCFRNAAVTSFIQDGYSYVEGLAISTNLPFPVQHAWCVDKDGFVVDPTWDDQHLCEYFGVEIDSETLREELLKNKVYGILALSEMANTEFMKNWEMRNEFGRKRIKAG